MYAKISHRIHDNDLVPKITGMLIDFEVLELGEILELLEND
jgi:hypothetical protein